MYAKQTVVFVNFFHNRYVCKRIVIIFVCTTLKKSVKRKIVNGF